MLDEFPDLAAAAHPQDTRLKLSGMLASGVYAAPDPYDNLSDGIEWATDIATRDPWCPAECRAMLVRWIADANRVLEALRT